MAFMAGVQPDRRALDLIAVGAHPDDVEIACGGTLAQSVRQGYGVGIVDLTDGEPTPLSPGPDIRLAEAAEAARILGVHVRLTLNQPNRRLFDDFESRLALAKVFRTYRPRVVLGFGSKTPMASPDHEQVMRITEAAVFMSRLTKWDEWFDGLPPHTITNQLAFPIGLHTLDFNVPQAHSRIVCDIGPSLETKLAAIRAYRTQFAHREERVIRLIETAARFIGQAAGYEAGELFFSYKTAGTRDLVAWACPEPNR
jgi:LmbE family N-acetylglucosaminyl deacetylase